MNSRKKQYIGAFYCISAAAIWGLSFVAQSIGKGVGTFTFNAIRMLIGSVVLWPVIAFRSRKQSEMSLEDKKLSTRNFHIGGLLAGIALFAGNNLQQEAFCHIEDVAKVGFITALYMLLVPIFNLFLGRKAKFNVWIGVFVGLIGLYLLCVKEGFILEKGDLIAIAGAFAFASQILIIDRYVPKTDAVKISSMQFFVCAILSGICMFIFEQPSLDLIMQKQNITTILYAGVMSCGVAFTFQTFGQQYTDPAVASILLCMESAFSLLFGWLILHQALETRALIGCGVMLVAILISQIQFPSKKSEGE